jgi:hypothetical protein
MRINQSMRFEVLSFTDLVGRFQLFYLTGPLLDVPAYPLSARQK